ncbi:DUF1861 family protein [Candidatus Pacearchaeota archaeon]|nr:DUF1861 family protein [Candidatus Pacearchaeota archaeon]
MLKQINIKSLLKYYKKSVISSKKLIFDIVDKDVYNITAPFHCFGKKYVAGRVESRKEHDSKIMFFIKSGGRYIVDNKAPVFNLEDPFITIIKNKIIFGGIEVDVKNVYRTVFFIGKDIYNLKKFKIGPKGMKDIRLILLPDERIGVLTRPQGKIGGRGRIGFMIVDSIKEFSELSEKDFYSAKLIPDRFDESEWLNANAIYFLKNNNLGVIGNIACFSKNIDNPLKITSKCGFSICPTPNENSTIKGIEHMKKNYYVISFNFDYLSNNFSGMKIIASRNELPKGKSKSPELSNILFPGGLIRNKNGTASLYVGVGDAEAYKIIIKDPFLESGK